MKLYKNFITLTLTLLLTLLFTACDSKTQQQEESNTITVENPTEEGGSTTGNGETNTTTTHPTSTITLASLNLSINKTSLNKDETITVKVMETYFDGSTNEVDANIEYIITPSDSIEFNGTVLTAMKDGDVTVQAKVNGVLSNTLNLTIAWVVSGHVLPPEPDPTINNSTLLGIDVNDNGVKDDVERWIYEEYKDKHPIYIDIAMQEGRGNKLILEHPDRAKEIYTEVERAIDCQAYYKYSAKYYGDPILIKENAVDEYFRSEIYFNTQERMDAYDEYDTLLSGDSYALPTDQERKAACDFNTSKYEEL